MRPHLISPEPELNETFDYIHDYWPVLTRDGKSLKFPLPGRFVKPGGFFRMFFYWDSYFIVLGLAVQGKWRLAREIVDNLVSEIEAFGLVPNYNGAETVCKSRSQPPLLTAALCEVYPYVDDLTWLARSAAAAEREYRGFWLADPHLTGTGLSRYCDTGGDGCGTVPDTPHHRAVSESGWDNTPRFGADATNVLPVDLNCHLYRYETDLAMFAERLGRRREAKLWRDRSEGRRGLIDRYLWDDDDGFYRDYDLRTQAPLRHVPRCLSSFMPLWAGVAGRDQADRLRRHLSRFECPYGLAACEPGWADGTEHNHPTGWAYSHWYVASGLRRYGFDRDATRIAMKWLRLVARRHKETGALRERYNVVDPAASLPGRYPPQRGFGWTNGVYAALLARVVFGLEPDPFDARPRWSPALPEEWSKDETALCLPDYPWPDGSCIGGAAGRGT